MKGIVEHEFNNAMEKMTKAIYKIIRTYQFDRVTDSLERLGEKIQAISDTSTD